MEKNTNTVALPILDVIEAINVSPVSINHVNNKKSLYNYHQKNDCSFNVAPFSIHNRGKRTVKKVYQKEEK